MKKIFTLLTFAFIFLLGTQSGASQNKIEINKAAAKKTEALYKAVKFSTEQRDLVYEALKDYEQAMAKYKLEASNDSEKKTKILQRLDVRMKDILNEEQYERYSSLNQ
ncbi:MAG: hypothetical protein AAF901_05190 [Bacteroidota bacterium]